MGANPPENPSAYLVGDLILTITTSNRLDSIGQAVLWGRLPQSIHSYFVPINQGATPSFSNTAVGA